MGKLTQQVSRVQSHGKVSRVQANPVGHLFEHMRYLFFDLNNFNAFSKAVEP